MTYRIARAVVLVALSLSFAEVSLHAVSWFPLGPYGGDARSFASDPRDSKHLYLGTATGWLYESHDGGSTWARLSQIMRRNDLVIDQVLTDPRNSQRVIVGAWCVERPDGGLFLSEDGGKTWKDQSDLRGQSIRALARSSSNPDMIVAGTLQGVFRTLDDGKHWQQISPMGSTEIHEIESLAFDPVNPQVIYAGTWHLPWKTVDGGAHWINIKQGIIEDSDVFSILVDPVHPEVVYASACSGIYKSVNSAAEFVKVKGIPGTARRTRKLLQDPTHLQTVYAGTTEGLYRSLDGGAQWDRMTGPDVIVNDVYVDPKNRNHVLLATDRGGVLSSDDFASSFHAANSGFSARQVAAYATDPQNPAKVYVGVVNDKETGGVFQSTNGGVSWAQDSAGLGGRDVFSLATTQDGVLLAGTAHGIFRRQDGLWTDASALAPAPALKREARVVPLKSKGAATKAAAAKLASPTSSSTQLDAVVYALVPDRDSIFAGTSQGLLRGDPDGKVWRPVRALQMTETRYVAIQKSTILVAALKKMALSLDGGERWTVIPLPSGLTQVSAIAVDGEHNLWVGGREGVSYSSDNGVTWKQLHDLVITQVNSIYFDGLGDRVLITCGDSSVVFSVHLPENKVSYWDSGWKLRFARPVGDYLLGVTMFDGVVVQPKMVDSSESSANMATGK